MTSSSASLNRFSKHRRGSSYNFPLNGRGPWITSTRPLPFFCLFTATAGGSAISWRHGRLLASWLNLVIGFFTISTGQRFVTRSVQESLSVLQWKCEQHFGQRRQTLSRRSLKILTAEVAELADALDSGSSEGLPSWRFESSLRHHHSTACGSLHFP